VRPEPQSEVDMPQRGARQQRPNPDAQLFAEIVEGVGRSLALSIEVFLHRGFGTGYVGCGPLAFLIMYLFSIFFTDQNMHPLAVFAGIYGLLWLIATVNVLIRWWRGMETVHSRYNGRAHLSRLLPEWTETNVKYLESLAVILLGYGIHRLMNRPLGDYLILAGVFVLIRDHGMASMLRQRAVELNDAVIEQRDVAERLAKMQQE
jgi:hypothetical protein